MASMTELDLLARAENGAVVLTANKRSARLLRVRYDARQRLAAKKVWDSPQILTWSAWLRSLWSEYVLRAPSAPVVLNSTQQLAIWEQIIRARQTRAMQTRATAQMAANAWSRLHEYKLPLEEHLYKAKLDTAVFYDWAMEFKRRTKANNWLDEARMPEYLASNFAMPGLPLPKEILLHGFDRFTPQQHSVLSALSNAGVKHEVAELVTSNESACVTAMPDASAEISAAANWSRSMLDANPLATIGIIVPDIEAHRGTLERALLEALHPQALSISRTDTRRAFELSLGRPLADTPVIGAALRLLRFAFAPISVEELGRLLRSPFLSGAVAESAHRALLDAALRALGQRDCTAASLFEAERNVKQHARCPQLSGLLRAFQQATRNLPERLKASEWSARIPDILKAISWPGDRVPNSAEHQAIDAWVDLLGDFAHLDVVEPWIARAEVSARLSLLAGETTFHPENTGAPVQVLGILEAAGSTFDHVWVMGLDESAWPPGSRPNPFLPLVSQRKALVPGASADIQYAYAERTTERLRCSGGTVVFSHGLSNGDSELRASSLLRNYEQKPADISTASYIAEMAASTEADIASVPDNNGPALIGTASGGTSVFKLQAACPFRAFAEIRLGAKKIDTPEPGLNAMVKGSVLHSALALIWDELKTQAELKKRSAEDLAQLVKRSVETALAKEHVSEATAWDREVAALERERLASLIQIFLKAEADRLRPFEVVHTEAGERREEPQTVTIGSVEIRIKADRIDHVPGVGYVVLDYKTSAPSTNSWLEDRPDEPQLPIYATRSGKKFDGVVFAQIRPGDMKYKGITSEDNVFPGVKTFLGSKAEAKSLETLLTDWNSALEDLAAEYQMGVAAVSPKKRNTTCRNCDLSPLCRIGEHKPDGDESDDEPDAEGIDGD